MPRTETLETFLLLAVPRERVFAFFADARNLEAITPAFLKFRVLTQGVIEMRPGAIIDYRLRLYGVPLGWRTEITSFEPPFRFVDEQVRGPYRLWRHEHLFEEVAATRTDPVCTRVTDRVTYQHIGGPVVHRLFVRPNLERIFAYRQQRIAELLDDTN